MVKVEKEKCIGCGACVAIAPDTFEFDENGLSQVIDGAAPSEAATEAIGSCPVGAIVEAAENAEEQK
jgi:ferredoxin